MKDDVALDPTDILQLVSRRTGLSASSLQGERGEHAVRDAMRDAMRGLGIDDSKAYLSHLESDATAFDALISELTVPETYFFRDPAHFRLIEETVLPALLSERPAGHVLQVWSAGCASGEEAYSLAILLEQHGLAECSRVLGTDISRRALARAAQAEYGPWALRGVDAQVLARYFEPHGERFVLEPRIVSRVAFAFHNLASGNYAQLSADLGGHDLILCRNVLLYLTPEMTRRAGREMAESLAGGGFLITGPSDPLLDLGPSCETRVTSHGVFYCKHADSTRRSARPIAARERAMDPLPQQLTQVAQADCSLQSGPHLALVTAVEQPPKLALKGRAEAIRNAASERGAEAALQLCQQALVDHPLCTELHYLNATLLFTLERVGEAEAALRRVLYLTPGLAVGHFLRGMVAHKLGNRRGARRAFLQAQRLCIRHGEHELLELGDGLSAGSLAEAAAREAHAVQERGPR